MIIEDKTTVTLTYEVRPESKEGQVADKADESNPLKFICGIGLMLPAFESNIKGKKAGDEFEFHLTNEEAYGAYYEEAVFDVPKKIFEVESKFNDEMVKVGVYIPMMDNQGNQRNGKVVEIKEDNVTMDFNHPLAGAELYFSGKILSVTETTEEELKQYEHECCGKHDHEEGHQCGCH